MRRRTTPVGTRLNYWRVRPRRGKHTGWTMGEILEEQYQAHLNDTNMGTTISDFINMSFNNHGYQPNPNLLD